MYPFALKDCKQFHFLINAPLYRFFLAMHRSGFFFFKALFLRAVRRPSAPVQGPYRRTLLVISCVVQTYFLRYLPSVGFWAFWVCPLGHAKITPVSDNLRQDFSFSFLCKLFRKGSFQSISCAADFGRLVPLPFRG